jgi:hypothetical protein
MTEPVHVRALSTEESDKLARIVRRGNGAVATWQRAQILLYAAQGIDAGDIAPMAFASEHSVRTVIDGFNQEGLGALYMN